jgi:hypothetical protein
MSENTAPEPAAPAQGEPGFFERAVEKVLPHAEVKAPSITGDVKGALTGHASSVFDVAGDLLALTRIIDPADAAAVLAVEALVPKVLAMAANAAGLASAALKSG